MTDKCTGDLISQLFEKLLSQVNMQIVLGVLKKLKDLLSSELGLVFLGSALTILTTLIFENSKERAKKLALRVAITSKVRDAYDRIFKHSKHFLEQLYSELDPCKTDVSFRV